VAPAAYLRRRAELCEAITARLDPVLTDALGPWQHHLCQTAIVSFIDERERVALGSLADAWRLPLVQSQLLQIDDGGDRCFVQLQDLLARVDVHELVFEVHLLCLRAGFVGRYRDRRHELDKIIGWLVERLRSYRPRHALPVVPDAPPVPRRRIGFLGFPVRYYVTVAVVVAGLFVVLRAVSAREVDQSDLATYCHYHESGAGP
jgi:type IV/VI secretion system ImpK/VasF family protein